MGLILIRDVWVLNDDFKTASKKDILIDGPIIKKVSDSCSIDGLAVDEVIEAKGNLLSLPGFVNAHTHIAMTLFRGMSEELPLKEWLETKIWPAEAKLNGEMVYWGTMLGIAELFSNGVSCFGDMYFFMDDVAKAVVETKARASLSRGLIASIEGDSDKRLKEGLTLADNWHGYEGRITVYLGPHAPYTCDPTFLRKVVDVALEYGLGVHIHWLETKWEVDYIKNKLRKDPVDLIFEIGFDKVKNVIFAHGVYFPRDRLKDIALSNFFVVHNPSSNMKLASGFAPVSFMIENGVNVALGTDGAASNDRLDMLWEMRLAALISKGYNLDPVSLKAPDVIKMATVNGARALGFEKLGLIKEGWQADIVLINLDVPNMVGFRPENLASMIVYSASCRDVFATIVGGNIVYKDGEYLTLDIDRVKFEVKRIIDMF